jgi:hypothetical protein
MKKLFHFALILSYYNNERNYIWPAWNAGGNVGINISFAMLYLYAAVYLIFNIYKLINKEKVMNKVFSRNLYSSIKFHGHLIYNIGYEHWSNLIQD